MKALGNPHRTINKPVSSFYQADQTKGNQRVIKAGTLPI